MSLWNISIEEECLGTTTNQIIGISLYCVYWLQYALNSFIYFFACPNYQKAFKQLLSSILCRAVKPRIVHTRHKVIFPLGIDNPTPGVIYETTQNERNESTNHDLESFEEMVCGNSLISVYIIDPEIGNLHRDMCSDSVACNEVSSGLEQSQNARIHYSSECSEWSFSLFSKNSRRRRGDPKRRLSLECAEQQISTRRLSRQFSC